jgi:hypothetical protein
MITPLVSSNCFLDVRLPTDSPGIPASSTTKTGRHDIAEILLEVAFIELLLKVALSTINPVNQPIKSRQ